MSERDLQDVLRKLKSSHSYQDSLSLLSKAKITLLKLHALTPLPTTSPSILHAAREIFETGALLSIRAKDPDAFTRYVHQLTPFYELRPERLNPANSEKNKITGLYLLLLLTQGNYSGFHTELEGLELRQEGGLVEDDRFLGYPIKLERWLMEGSYDLVWKAMASREVPSEEYSVFSEVSFVYISNFYIMGGSVLMRTNRSLHPKFGTKSRLAARQHTPRSPSRQLRTYFSWIARGL
jgi:26S proteasome regulatory subunit N12